MTALLLTIQNSRPMFKFFANRQAKRQTDRAKTICQRSIDAGA